MSGETAEKESGWTVDTLAEYHKAMREADQRFDSERDRRYTEVALEREKALKIKETADLAALSLAREIQDYKDEKANNLRDQILATESKYATKEDLTSVSDKLEITIKPVVEYVATQQGRGSGIQATLGAFLAIATIAASLSGAIVYLILHR